MFKTQNRTLFLLLAVTFFSLTSCLTSKKLDKYVAAQYNNELPKQARKKRPEIDVAQVSSGSPAISTTVHKTDKFLPLLVYWKYNHRQSCSLNPSIAVTQFSNTVNAVATKGLTDKLAGRKLELTVEQAPAAFSIVAKEQMIWLVYAVSWAKIYIEPDMKDLVVSYKLTDAGKALKAGTISVKNTDKNKGLRFFQSWKSATSEYLSEYNANLTSLTKSFVTQLTQEL
jgi:hypothetical protein